MKNSRNVFIILAILTIFATLLSSTVFATNTTYDNVNSNNEECIKISDGETSSVQDIINAGNSFIAKGKENATDGATDPVNIALKLLPIGSLLVAVGIAVLVIVLAIMAIRWITAKPDQKAKLQQQLIGYVAACFVIFGAIWIWNFVTGIMQDVENKLAEDKKPATVYIEKV